MKHFLVALLVVITANINAAYAVPGFVMSSGAKFIDPEGRQILFHGMSIINKDKAGKYRNWQQPVDYKRMHDWGMNCIRLGVLWDGLEPEPFHYDEEYLKQIDQHIQWAKENEIYVFLDMHQDLFGAEFSDGAPKWATLTDGNQHVSSGGVWSDAYFTSPAVQAAFDNFWANKPGPDGVGIQEHFAKAWGHLAQRYANEPAVIGYDLYNEPNMGAKNLEAQLIMAGTFVQLLRDRSPDNAPSILDIMGQWVTPDGRSKLMDSLRDMSVYLPVLDALEPVYSQFEKELLMPMYSRVTQAIRAVDNNHLIFLETAMPSNGGVRSGIEAVTLPDGSRAPLQAYAPHGYDIVVDTPDLARASTDRIEVIFSRHNDTSKRLNMPMLIGEWGAFGSSGSEIIPSARAVVRQFEKYLCGETYWEYGKYTIDCAYSEILARPLPLRVAGALTAYHGDPDSHVFECTWEEASSIAAPTVIYLPEPYYSADAKIDLSAQGAGYTMEPAKGQGKAVYVTVAPMKTSGSRKFTVSPQ